MKALIQKELRENLKLAVLGLLIFALILALFVYSHEMMMKSLAAGGSFYADSLQPLASPDIWGMIGFFCAIFAAVLGWFQIHHERHRDLWAFLVHRPATRTQIFLGKVLAGLALYALVVALPLAVFISWALAPGHVAAPFEWTMLRPVIARFLAGIVFYFAGMLTGLRQARWYASRAFGLGAALIVSTSVTSEPYLWQTLGIILIGGAILATATWGGFHSQGFFRDQPAPGKLALIGTLALGALIITVFAALLSSALLLRSSGPWTFHQMTKDGTIYRVTQGAGKPAEIVDLDGKPLTEPKTGQPVEMADFNRRMSNQARVDPDFSNRTYRRRWYDQSFNRFILWRATPDTLWYYGDRCGRLVGYDKATRRFIGSLGPDGFTRDLSPTGARFDNERNQRVLGRIINDAQTVYELDLEHRAVRALFTVTNESCEATLGSTNADTFRRTIGAVREVSLNSYDWDYTMVVTRCFTRLLTPEGKVVWQVAYQPPYPDYDQVMVFFLEPTNQFALWMAPSRRAQGKAGGKLPTHVTWLDRDGKVLKSVDLPKLSSLANWPNSKEKLLGLSVPPTLVVTAPLFDDNPWPAAIPWRMMPYSLAAALVCIPVGWWLGRRYQFTLRAQLGWAAFYLLWGIPALLAFLCVQEWPAREECSNCKKLRVVDREKCPHCGADFAPPEKTGIEVFEPLADSPG
jgi:ABC-type transport system involved in multi-copper enzyme maturation permease subunit